MAGQVLDISKHENAVRATRPASSGRCARLYRFPARTQLAQPRPEAPVESPHSRFRLHLAIELAIAIAVWLTWFVWQHLH